MRQRFVWVWAMLALTVVLIGCWGAEQEAVTEAETYNVRGVFARVEDDGMTMTVRHEEIPGYMAAMTMPFKVREASLLDGLEYGDKIQFELVVDKEGSVVTSIEKLPPETVLAFETPD